MRLLIFLLIPLIYGCSSNDDIKQIKTYDEFVPEPYFEEVDDISKQEKKHISGTCNFPEGIEEMTVARATNELIKLGLSVDTITVKGGYAPYKSIEKVWNDIIPLRGGMEVPFGTMVTIYISDGALNKK